jgi:archaemetzincin
VPDIVVVPFGDIETDLLARLQSAFKDVAGLDVRVGAALSVPGSGLKRRRRQFLAGVFLEELARKRPAAGAIMIGITRLDLFVTGLNFVFGMADRGEQVAVVSLARLSPEFYREPPDTALFDLRLLKEAVHELGHVIGLDHCQRPGCIMSFSSTIADTDQKGPGFCNDCRRRLPSWFGR